MNDLVEFGKVLIQWGTGFIITGVATVLIGLGIIAIGKVFFEDATDLVLAFIKNSLSE